MNKQYKADGRDDYETSDKKKNAKKKANFPRQVSQMESKLGALFNRTRVYEGQLPDIETLGEEGVDHINISRGSKTRLGYLLTTNAEINFELFGTRFTSIDNLMLFYRSHCTMPVLATCSMNHARQKYTEQLDRFPFFQNMYVIVCLAYAAILKKTPELLEALNQNTLPLDNYYHDRASDKRMRRKTSHLLVRAVTEAHKAVRNRKDPELEVFVFRDMINGFKEAYYDIPYQENFSFYDFLYNEFSIKKVQERYHGYQDSERDEPLQTTEDRVVSTEEAKPEEPEEIGNPRVVAEETLPSNQLADQPTVAEPDSAQ